jgi:6-phosphofructokinase 1
MMRRIGVLTSGGDAPGMNAAVRAIVRCGLQRGLEVFGIAEGYEGLIQGGEMIRPLGWRDVGGILQAGGTILGTARSRAFRTPEGRREAARTILRRGLDGLVVIGGDGSLSGAQAFHDEWPAHVAALAEAGVAEARDRATGQLRVVGLPGSIDNDLYGTDMAIGSDTALNTVVRNIDQLVSTANAHQRTFVVEVMGRHCGYLALMGAIATGGDWVLLPEEELAPRWHNDMVAALGQGRAMGRRHAMVLCAEGARHTDGLPISSGDLQRLLTDRLGVDVRVTVLGHVQRGGAPSAFDRILATRLGAAAVDHLADAPEGAIPVMFGLIANRPVATPLPEVVEKSRGVIRGLDAGNYGEALGLRNRSFREALTLWKTLSQAAPPEPAADAPAIAILSGDADAPGMNAAVRAIVRTALQAGYRAVGVENGFLGLVEGQSRELGWMSISGWAGRGGTELGTSRYRLGAGDTERIAAHLREQRIGALVCLGGLVTYQEASRAFGALGVPLICVPATIDNNLPGTHFAIGADTALNSIIGAIDKLKDAAVTRHRTFLIEVMGRGCGYLALLAGLGGGAERAYLPEEGITLAGLQGDVRTLMHGFRAGKKLAIVINNEQASPSYDTDFLRRVFEQEGGTLAEARATVLGHLQRGGPPTAFDRLLGARLGSAAATAAIAQLGAGEASARAVGVEEHGIVTHALTDALAAVDPSAGRPREQWWWPLRDLLTILGQPEAGWHRDGAM